MVPEDQLLQPTVGDTILTVEADDDPHKEGGKS